MERTEKMAVYYALFTAETTGVTASQAYREVAPLFLGENESTKKLITDYESAKDNLDSVAAIDIYKRYLSSFCPDKSIFGYDPNEEALIDMKRDILEYLNICKRAVSNHDVMACIAANPDAVECASVGYALGLYITNKDARQTCIGILENAVTDSDSIAACMILMSLDKQNARKWFETLKVNPSVWLYNNLLDRLAEYHSLDKSKTINNNLTFWGRKDSNV